MLDDLPDIDVEGEIRSDPGEWDEEQLRREKRHRLGELDEQSLCDELEQMAEEMETLQEAYEVESPDELRTSVDDEMGAEERRERRRAAYDWRRNLVLREMVLDVLGD